MTKLAVVLIGHGAPATDCPPQLIGELMSLEWRAGDGHGHPHAAGQAAAGGDAKRRAGARPGDRERRAGELDAAIRGWPRHAGNDPYKIGLERLAEAMKPLLPTKLLAVGYNEFCRPSIAEAVEQVIRQGATRVLVVPSMLTPGGVHAEVDIPQALAEVRAAHPAVAIEYVWPFDLEQVAALLAAHITQAIAQTAA